MLTRDQGIVLRRIPLGETSWIVSFLGAGSGRVRLVARGARSPRSRLGGSLEVGTDLDAVFDVRPGRDLGYLREVSSHTSYLGGKRDLAAIGAGLGILEIVERVIPEGGGDAALLDEVRGALAALGGGAGRSHALVILYAFELRLLDRLGIGPDWEACATCGSDLDRGGWLDVRAGTLNCRACGRSASQCHAVSSAALARIATLGSCSWVEVAGVELPEPGMRRSIGLLLHRLLGMHVERYRLPEALQLIPKVDNSPRVEGSRPPHPGLASRPPQIA